jgi:hypothetical protein
MKYYHNQSVPCDFNLLPYTCVLLSLGPYQMADYYFGFSNRKFYIPLLIFRIISCLVHNDVFMKSFLERS